MTWVLASSSPCPSIKQRLDLLPAAELLKVPDHVPEADNVKGLADDLFNMGVEALLPVRHNDVFCRQAVVGLEGSQEFFEEAFTIVFC